VLKGSRTVRYGSAALGGVISLETKTDAKNSLEAIYGSFDTQIYRASFSQPLGEWNLTGYGEKNRSSSYRDVSSYDSESWSAVLSSPENEPFQVKFYFSGSEQIFDNPGGLIESQFRNNPRQSVNLENADFFTNVSDHFSVGQGIKWDLSDKRKLTLRSSWRRREREFNFGMGNHNDQTLDTLFAEFVFSEKGDRVSWDLGLRGNRDQLDHDRFGSISRTLVIGDADLDRLTLGAFIQGQYQWGNHWSVTGGIAWDHWQLDAQASDLDNVAGNFDENRNDDGFGAELSLAYESDHNWSVWMRYDRVYRFPVLDEIASYQGFVQAQSFNEDLKSESGHALEIGWDYEGESLTWKTTLFSQWLDDEIGFDGDERLNVNFARTHRFGIENSLRWSFENLDLRINHSYTEGKYLAGEFQGNEVPLIPRHLVTARMTWKPHRDLSLILGANYLSKRRRGNDFENEGDKIPSRFLVNSQLRWSASEELDLFLKVENIFDRQYPNLIFSDLWYPGDGRYISVGARYEF